jgi:hypothetical protein
MRITSPVDNQERKLATYASTDGSAAVAANPERPCKLRFDILEAQLLRACPCDDQKIQGRLQFAPILPKKLSYEPLDPVSANRVADFSAHGHAEPAIRSRPALGDHDEMRRF